MIISLLKSVRRLTTPRTRMFAVNPYRHVRVATAPPHGWKKKPTAMIAYTITRSTPSYQLLSPSDAIRLRTATDRAIDTSSKGSNPRVRRGGPRNAEANTRIGATNSAICVLELVQIPTLRSILFLHAI